MTPENFSRRSTFHRVGLYLLFLSVLGVAGGALVYTSVMQYLGWSVQPGVKTFSVSLSQKPSLLLYRSPHTERYLSTVGGNYGILIKPWRDFATEKGLGLSELSTLEGLSPGGNTVLVLPSAIALDAAERTAILRYRESGGALVISWASGSRGGAGEWLGWDFMRQLTDVKVLNDSRPSNLPLLTIGEGPVTHAFPAGSRISLTPVTEKPLELAGGLVALISAAPSQGVAEVQAGTAMVPSAGLVVINELGVTQPSRVAVLGMAETAWEKDKPVIHNLLTDVFDWLIRKPIVMRSQWPDGQRTAAFVRIDVLSDSTDLIGVAPTLQQATLTGSVYLPPGMDQATDAALRSQLTGWETGYWMNDPSQLPAVLSSSVLRGSGPGSIKGVHVQGDMKLGLADQSMFDAGVRYRLGGGSFKSEMPELAPVNGQKPGIRFVTLPDSGGKANLQQSSVALSTGGLGSFNWGPSNAHPPGVAPSWITLVRQPSASVWVTNAAQVADWWLERERFQLGTRYLGARTEIDVSVLGSKPFDRAALIVVLPFKGRLPLLKGLKPSMPVPVLSLLDGYRALIRFERLDPGDYSYQITF